VKFLRVSFCLIVWLLASQVFAGNADWKDKGYGIKVHKSHEMRNGKLFTRYDYTINLPCFYTAPGNTPCTRGSMRKNGRGTTIPINSAKQLQNAIPKANPVFDSSGRYLLNKP